MQALCCDGCDSVADQIVARSREEQEVARSGVSKRRDGAMPQAQEWWQMLLDSRAVVGLKGSSTSVLLLASGVVIRQTEASTTFARCTCLALSSSLANLTHIAQHSLACLLQLNHCQQHS